MISITFLLDAHGNAGVLDIVDGQRFIDYSDPKLYCHLLSTNTLHRHHDQIRNDLVSVQSVVVQHGVEPFEEQKYEQSRTQPPSSVLFVEQQTMECPVSVAAAKNTESVSHRNMESERSHNEENMLIFRQFTASDYDYSDSEQDDIAEIERNRQMPIEMELLLAKYDKFSDDLHAEIPNLHLFEDLIGNDLRNRLCPHCLMFIWTEQHHKECLFIPQCLK